MKNRLPGLFILILFLSRVYANDTSSFRAALKPIGFIDSDHLMEGFIGSNSTIEYETPSIEIKKSPDILPALQINYTDLLMSGIKSLLFEYKNYRGGDHLSSYSVFANGNYSVIDEKLLGIANKYLFRNRTLLNQLYKWALPSYREAFQLLTYEEQHMQQKNLEVAEKFIELVLKQKNRKAFNAWLRKKGVEEDEKITGFLKRRILKKQWTIDDCSYWLARIKKDIMPLMKDPGKGSSHYQNIEKINEKLYMAVDGKGYYFMVNEKYKPLTYGYAYIIQQGDSLIAMRSDSDDDSYIYSISEYNQNGTFKLLPFPEWNTYTPITDSSGIFTSRRKSGIYDQKNKKYILDNCTFIRNVAHSPYVIAKKMYGDYPEGKEHEARHYLLYNYNGQKLTDEAVYVYEEMDYSTDEIVCTYNVATSPDGKIIAFVNEDKKAGLIDSSGKLVASFQYEWVDFSEYPHKVYGGYSVLNKMTDTILLD